MATRKVIVASTAANRARSIQTSATTWGELSSQSDIADLMVGSVEAIVNPGNVTLSRPDAVLPNGDFTLYITPTKNKAGGTVITEQDAMQLGREIGEAISTAIRKATNNDVTSLKSELMETIEDFFDVELNGEDCPECEKALQEARNY